MGPDIFVVYLSFIIGDPINDGVKLATEPNNTNND